MQSINVKTATIKDATHYLQCAHQIGHGRTDYVMSCIPLNTVPSGRIKVLVFGERYWKGYDDKKSIRYVSKSRIYKIKLAK